MKSTTVYGPSLELGLSLSRQRVCVCPSPRNQRGGGEGGHSAAGEGWGSPNYDDWRKSLALCLLCERNRLGLREVRYGWRSLITHMGNVLACNF